ncbi:hypothetical protein [Streptomyces sp. NPDC057293]|uniref:hypothetical protein n=1 Tax=unclassified Streptomyces TaxID=2593676 RepID=UPI003633E79C
MSALTVIAGGKHSSPYQELRAHNRRIEDDNTFLTGAVEEREQQLHTALIRGCQDAVVIAALRAELGAVKAANADLRRTTIRAKAEQERLRRAVVNARPRIREVPTDLVRPYSPVVVLPYVSPVPHRDTSNDETQEIALIDLPQPWPTYPAA